MNEDRFQSYFGETTQIALEQVPPNRKVLEVLKQKNQFTNHNYIEVVTEPINY